MRELDEEYGDKLQLEVKQAVSEEGQAAVEKYGFGGPRHGLVGFGPDGEVAFVKPGHRYSKEEIVEDLKPLLD